MYVHIYMYKKKKMLNENLSESFWVCIGDKFPRQVLEKVINAEYLCRFTAKFSASILSFFQIKSEMAKILITL